MSKWTCVSFVKRVSNCKPLPSQSCACRLIQCSDVIQYCSIWKHYHTRYCSTCNLTTCVVELTFKALRRITIHQNMISAVKIWYTLYNWYGLSWQTLHYKQHSRSWVADIHITGIWTDPIQSCRTDKWQYIWLYQNCSNVWMCILVIMFQFHHSWSYSISWSKTPFLQYIWLNTNWTNHPFYTDK